MYLSYQDIKGTLYVVLTLVGLGFLPSAFYCFSLMSASVDPVTYLIPGVILLFVGSVSTFFGLETYLLRDDPDIWR
jgi:hypothetical protein